MPHAIQIRQTGGPEVLNWTPIEGKVRIKVNQRFALKDAADATRPWKCAPPPGPPF